MAYIQKKPSREEDRICSGLKLKLSGPQINQIHCLAYWHAIPTKGTKQFGYTGKKKMSMVSQVNWSYPLKTDKLECFLCTTGLHGMAGGLPADESISTKLIGILQLKQDFAF